MMELTEFEKYVLKNHPDPDHITHIVESKDRKKVKVYLEWEPIVRLAERYAESKVIKYQKKQMIKKGLNST